jgi:hypothetical protein
MPGGAFGRLIFPVVLPLAPMLTILPVLALLFAIAIGRGGPLLLWAMICVAANLLWWALIYRGFQQRVWYALLHPVGAAALLFIIVRAIMRGRRVGWKGRDYVAQ